MAHLLIVDDEAAIAWGISQLACDMGHTAETASSAEQGLDLAAARPPDLIVLDVRLPGIDGLEAMNLFRQRAPSAAIVVITAFGDLQTAVRAVRQGALEQVVKPFDLATLRGVIERALHRGVPSASLAATPAAADDDAMLGDSPAMQETFKQIALAAHSDAAVLLWGESGVGKELAARAIHRHSARAAHPLVAVNVAALSPALAEAELFGHTAGAFTGAAGPRKGLLPQAHGGTLLLDEVAEMPLPLQVKLLRALDLGEVLPVGADRPVKVDFRLISASHRDLREEVRAGRFRHDLFFRLSAFGVRLPPLRERADDIPQLARHFAVDGDRRGEFSAEALAELRSRPWYGNVRELRNAVRHAMVLCRGGAILPSHLPPPAPQLEQAGKAPVTNASLQEQLRRRADWLVAQPELAGDVHERYLQEVESPLLESALARHQGQLAPAARTLGVHRTTLRRKLENYGLGPAAE